MIGILLVSHGPLAEGLFGSYCFFQNDQRQVKTIVLKEEDDPSDLLASIQEACEAFEQVNGILILCDIPGGTPANMAQKFAQGREDIRIISGCNLMMVLDAVLSREQYTLDELSNHCIVSAKESIQLLCTQVEQNEEDLEAEF